MALDVVKALGLQKVYALGTSQGGFIGMMVLKPTSQSSS
jgi:pimeloyl-ACP methyl ester carboxylesterase